MKEDSLKADLRHFINLALWGESDQFSSEELEQQDPASVSEQRPLVEQLLCGRPLEPPPQASGWRTLGADGSFPDGRVRQVSGPWALPVPFPGPVKFSIPLGLPRRRCLGDSDSKVDGLIHGLSACSLIPSGLTPARKALAFRGTHDLKQNKKQLNLGGGAKVKSQTSYPAGIYKLDTHSFTWKQLILETCGNLDSDQWGRGTVTRTVTQNCRPKVTLWEAPCPHFVYLGWSSQKVLWAVYSVTGRKALKESGTTALQEFRDEQFGHVFELGPWERAPPARISSNIHRKANSWAQDVCVGNCRRWVIGKSFAHLTFLSKEGMAGE